VEQLYPEISERTNASVKTGVMAALLIRKGIKIKEIR